MENVAQTSQSRESPIMESPTQLNPFQNLEAYRLATEYKVSFGNPNTKRLKGFEEFEINKKGRMAYIPEKDTKSAEGIVPLYNGTSYPIIIPKYSLSKLAKHCN